MGALATAERRSGGQTEQDCHGRHGRNHRQSGMPTAFTRASSTSAHRTPPLCWTSVRYRRPSDRRRQDGRFLTQAPHVPRVKLASTNVLLPLPATYTVRLMRNRGLLLLIAPTLLAACGGSHTTGGRRADPEAVIRSAMSSPAGRAIGLEGLFPAQPKSVSCVIQGGGPGLQVHGTCASRVRSAADRSAVATFVETWDGRVFHGPGSDATPGLSHTWEFHVSKAQQVTSSRSFGDFPPQSVK